MPIKAKAKRIRELCELAIKTFTPKVIVNSEGVRRDETYCNCAIAFIANELGYEYFKSLTANKIVMHMDSSADFAKVAPDVAKTLADDGNLVIAGLRGDPHGHVAAVYPCEPLVPSVKWGKPHPTLANVGADNKIAGASWCFSKEPKYYVLIQS